MTVRFRSLAFLIYVIIGIVVAWNRGYIIFAWLKATASVLLVHVHLVARGGDPRNPPIKGGLPAPPYPPGPGPGRRSSSAAARPAC